MVRHFRDPDSRAGGGATIDSLAALLDECKLSHLQEVFERAGCTLEALSALERAALLSRLKEMGCAKLRSHSGKSRPVTSWKLHARLFVLV